jgi:exonuclease VII large subunit
MSEETLDKDAVIASLIESNECLRGELLQTRNNNRILRRVHSALRSANEALRKQVDLAAQNDDLFKRFCQGEFDAKVTSTEEGGLLESGTKVDQSA